ncbi:MAG: PAS domain S-box protein [Desulfobacterales bacterium]|nr:PAS domain S-box protein [Desulfobacterales bacterium]
MSSIFSRIRDYLLNFRHLVMIGFITFIFIFGIASFLVYQNYWAMRTQINKDFNQQQLVLAQQAAIQISWLLRDMEIGLDNLRYLLTGNYEQGHSEAMTAVFAELKIKGLTQIGLTDSEGKTLYHAGSPESFDLEKITRGCKLDGAEQLILGPLQVEKVTADKSTVTSIICTPLPFKGGATGVLFAKLDVAELVRKVAEHILSGKTGYSWIINKQGKFIYHPEDEFIGEDAFSARKKRKSHISYVQINRIMKDRMLNGEEGMGTYVSGWHRGLEGQMTKLIAFAPVESPVLPAGRIWSVAVVAPISEVADIIHKIYVRHFAAGAAIIAGMFVFMFLVFHYQQKVSWALKQRVHEQEGYLENILTCSLDGIVFIDTDNIIQMWNYGAEAIFGYTAEEMIGSTFHRLIPPEMDADMELERIQQEVISKGFIKDYIAQRLTKSGRRITVSISRRIVTSDEGEIIGSSATIKDITEKMELDQHIYNAEKLASVGIMAAGVAHEINNPLSIILGFADLLAEKFEPGSQEHKDLKMIEKNANHAKKIVENLLGFARMTEGFEETVDISQSVNIVINIVKNTLLTKKIDLMKQIPENLPRVHGDGREFQQVVFNLVNNSMAAMDETGGTLILSAYKKDGWVSLSVADTGIGIPDAVKPKIFDPFFTTKKVGEGTGLGLSLCYGIVKKYGGDIKFKSRSAENNPEGYTGTTFTVSMPIYEPEEPEKEDR